MMQHDPTNVVITGAGGQGNVAAAQWLGQALMDEGLGVTVGDTYGLSQRGGSVMSHIRISRKRIYGPIIPQGRAHLILGLEPVETLRVLERFGNPQVVVVTNSRPVYPQAVIAGEFSYPTGDAIQHALKALSSRVYWIPATKLAQELGGAIMANVVMIGALLETGVVPVSENTLLKVLEATLPPHTWDANRRAFRKGVEAVRDSPGAA